MILGRSAGRPRGLLLDVHHALADVFTMELLAEAAALCRSSGASSERSRIAPRQLRTPSRSKAPGCG
jgi:hypothetical protein